MSASITVAIVTGIASILAALFAWSQAIRASRIKAETDLALEQMKLERARRQHAFEIASAEIDPIMGSLGEAWADIQTVKEVLKRFIAPAHYDARSALQLLEPATRRLAQGYVKHGFEIPDAARVAWHSAKSTAALLEAELQENLARRATGKAPPSDVIKVLREAGNALSEYQMVIFFTRQNLRETHAQRILTSL